jgi:hypothetical protein
MQSQIDDRRQEIRNEIGSNSEGGRQDVFSTLVRANEREGEAKLRLDDSELVSGVVALRVYILTLLFYLKISDVFLLLLAGHGQSFVLLYKYVG